MKDVTWERVGRRLPVLNSAIVPLSDVRSNETSAQNTRGKNFQKFTCSNFCGFVFRGSYFRVLVVGRENRENLDLTKISRYTVLVNTHVSKPDVCEWRDNGSHSPVFSALN